ncbi:helix-turn-helix domain-containing protein [Seonamhaeicola sp. MEBiC1930]|uniref:AraC family transcriptional regulator n=1 Tax=Seonamhaeicola sp. MEBiC01930 TaxID=2976768 RepID=UPI0032566DEC
MGLRIGKSVMLHFGNELEPKFIFAGLALLLLIGPLLKWYINAMTQIDYKLPKYYYLDLIPFTSVFILSFFVTKDWFSTKNNEIIILFASILIFIYLHFAFYIFKASKQLKTIKKSYSEGERTKSQKAILLWLNLLIVGFVFIWISYFLNIIEDTVPYIVGPLMYSLVVYFLSFKAFQLKVADLDGNVFKKNEDFELFKQLSDLIVKGNLYLEPNVSLSSLGKLINKNTQKTSELINQYANQNFNDFINHYRILEAKKLLLEHNKYTISSIAYDVGFSSLSSFNSAFKKFEEITPSSYRKQHIPNG